jgi:hypothetical protein
LSIWVERSDDSRSVLYILRPMKRNIFSCVAFLSALAVCAQTPTKDIHSREQLWLGYFNQTRITNKFGLWLDVHYRRTDNFVDRPFQIDSTCIELLH